jgi:hypothetical protein
MKSAFELAMERLQKQAPSQTLNDRQKAELADIESLYKSRLAQLEISMGDEIQEAESSGDFALAEELRGRLVAQRQRIEEEKEGKKEVVRRG